MKWISTVTLWSSSVSSRIFFIFHRFHRTFSSISLRIHHCHNKSSFHFHRFWRHLLFQHIKTQNGIDLWHMQRPCGRLAWWNKMLWIMPSNVSFHLYFEIKSTLQESVTFYVIADSKFKMVLQWLHRKLTYHRKHRFPPNNSELVKLCNADYITNVFGCIS